MVKESWLCGDCQKPYLDKNDAEGCETKHEEARLENLRIHKENSKMIWAKGIEVTKNAFETHQGGLDFQTPKDCDLIMLMGNKGGGYVPFRCLLPHQVYVSDVRKIFEESEFEAIYILPVKSDSIFALGYKDKYSFDRWKESDAKKGAKR